MSAERCLLCWTFFSSNGCGVEAPLPWALPRERARIVTTPILRICFQIPNGQSMICVTIRYLIGWPGSAPFFGLSLPVRLFVAGAGLLIPDGVAARYIPLAIGVVVAAIGWLALRWAVGVGPGSSGIAVVPLLALLLLITSFIAKIAGGVKWAGLVFGFVVAQVALGLLGHSVSIAGGLHGLNALALFAAALYTARRARAVSGSPAAELDKVTASV